MQTSFRGERADNAASGLLEQISAGINTSDSHYKQYTDSQSRTHEYQQMASNTDTLSAQARSNYTQEYVGYVHSKLSDDEAREVLTNTNSEAVRMRREDLAESFVEDKLRGRLDSHYDQAASHVGDGIRHPGNTAKAAAGAYQGVMGEIDSKAQDKNIRFDTKQRAEQSYNNIENTQKTQDDYVDAREQENKQEVETRKAGVETAKQDYRLKQKAAELHQASWNPWYSKDSDFMDDAKEAIKRRGCQKC